MESRSSCTTRTHVVLDEIQYISQSFLKVYEQPDATVILKSTNSYAENYSVFPEKGHSS